MNGENHYRTPAGSVADMTVVIRLDLAVKTQVGLNKIKLEELPRAFIVHWYLWHRQVMASSPLTNCEYFRYQLSQLFEEPALE